MTNTKNQRRNQCGQFTSKKSNPKQLGIHTLWRNLLCWLALILSNVAVAQMQPLPSTGPIADPITTSVQENSTNNVIPSLTSGGALSVQVTTPASHGVVTVSGMNFIYTPNANYNGSDSFSYTAQNTGGTSAPALVSITVTPIPPTVNTVSVNLPANSINNIIPANIIGTATTVSLVSTPLHGSASVSGLNIIYTPTAGYFGADTFLYKASNIAGDSAPASVSINVIIPPPAANPVSASVVQNSSSNIIGASITGSATSLAISAAPAHGHVTVSGMNFVYTPNAGYYGSDSFSYTAQNAGGTSAPALVSVTVTPIPPTVNTVSVNLTANSINNIIPANIVGTATTVSLVSTPLHGSASVSGLNIIYTPTAGYIGADTFLYKASNIAGDSAPASVSIYVNGTPPVANPVSTSVAQNSSSNVINPSITGTATTLAISALPSHGNATVSGMTILYTPSPNYYGPDSFSYIASNASGTSPAADVNITVNQVAPTANTVNGYVLANSSNNVIPSSILGTATSITLTSAPANGSASVSGLDIVYTPNVGFVGTDNFKYIASNAAGSSGNASIFIAVSGVAPVANLVTANVLQNSSSNIISSNITGTANNLTIVSPPAHGTASISGLNLIYTPAAGYVGPDHFTYSAANTFGISAAADVNINVNGVAPIASPIVSNVLINSSNNSIASNVSGSVNSIAIASAPLHGTASVSGLTILYSPTSGYVGNDSFTYTATNSYGTSSAATISVTINGVAPNASAVSATVFTNSTGNLIASSTSGGASSIVLVTAPSFGSANISGMSISYTPNPGFIGTDNFSYAAQNTFGTSSPASVSVVVKDSVPVASAVDATVLMNSSGNIIAPNATGTPTSIVLTSAPSHGSASVSGLQIIYTPNANYVGDDSFNYRAVNSSGSSSNAPVNIRVSGNVPIANPITATVLANSSNNTIASQTSGVVSSIAILSVPQHGVAQVSGTSILYTPTADYIGDDAFTYIASNSFGNSVAASVNITVSPVVTPSLPSASDVSVNVLSNSSNNTIAAATSGVVTSIGIGQAPSKGVVNVNGLSMSYTPTPGFIGSDSYTYFASNTAGNSAPATVRITVSGIAPVANPVTASIPMNSSNQLLTPSINGTASSISLNSNPTHGLATIAGMQISYTPQANFIGVDTFTYIATNSTGSSAPATVTITVNGVGPTAAALSMTVDANSRNNLIASNASSNTDSLALASLPTHGNASISGLNLSYTPQANFSGADSFTYIAKNAFGDSTPATVSITVKPLPTLPLPIANAVSTEVMINSNANSIAANVTGSYTQLNISTNPAHGSVTISGNQFIYTPAKDFSGSDRFSYLAINASGRSNEAFISINVKQTPPTANAISAVVEATQSNVLVRANTSGTVDRISIGSAPSHGTVSINGLDILYTPTANFVGTDNFTYLATNAAGNSAPATVTVNVKAKPPTLANGNIQVLAGTSASIDLASLISQTAGTTVSFSIATQAAHANASISGTRLTVSAHLNYAGSDQVRIIASANGLTSNTAVITLTITGRPDPARDLIVQALQTTKAAVITQFERLQLENFNSRLNEIASQNSGLRNKEDRKKNEDACSKVALWAGGLNSFSSIAADYEIKQHNGGVSFGGDRCLGSPDSILGFGVGYANSRGELRGQNASMNAQARNVANYGQIKPLPFFNFSWVLGVNDISSDYTRTAEQVGQPSGMATPPSYGMMPAPANSTQHTGKWSGKQKMGSTSIGFDVDYTNFKISPYVRLDRSVVTIDAYTETGDQRSALHYQAQSFNSQRTTLGMNAETQVKTSFGELTPRLRFEYQKDVGKRDDMKINFVDNPDSTPYVISGSKLDRKLFHMGIGGDLLLENGWVIILNYGYYRSNEGNSSNALRVRLSYRL